MSEKTKINKTLSILLIVVIVASAFYFMQLQSANNNAAYTISSENDMYYARNTQNNVVSKSTYPETVINYAITTTSNNGGGEVFVKHALYPIGLSGTGIHMMKNVDLIAENTGSISPVTGVILRQSANIDVISYVTSAAGSEGNIKIQGFSFDGSGNRFIGNALNLVNVSIALLSTLRIYNFYGAAIYTSNLFSSSVTDVIADNCGNQNSQTATLVFSSNDLTEYKTGCANLQLNNLQVSTNNYRALDLYGADITVNHLICDAQATPQTSIYGAIKIFARSRVIGMNDIFVRNSAAGTNAIENQADTSTWSGVTVEYALGTCFANSAYGSSAQLTNVYFKGVNSTQLANLGFDVQAGTVQVNNYNTQYVLSASSTGPTGVYQVTNYHDGVPLNIIP